jgi:PAS domain-containing protein
MSAFGETSGWGTGGMERLTSRILQRSSDAIVVVRLADAAILGVNEAFLAVTGHPRHEVTGRLSHHVLAAAGPRCAPSAG